MPSPTHSMGAPSGCDSAFDVAHALSCRTGGFVNRRHNDLVKAWKALFREAGMPVDTEPYIPPPDGHSLPKGTTTDLDARADLRVQGVFTPMKDVYLDVVVADTGCPSAGTRPSKAVLAAKEALKRTKYEARVAPHADFFPRRDVGLRHPRP